LGCRATNGQGLKAGLGVRGRRASSAAFPSAAQRGRKKRKEKKRKGEGKADELLPQQSGGAGASLSLVLCPVLTIAAVP